MSKFLKRYVGRTLVGISVSAWFGTGAFAASNGSEPVLIIRVLNSAQLPNDLIAEAQRHFQSIYRSSRIQSEWQIDNESDQFSSGWSLKLTIVLLPECRNRTLGHDCGSTAFALSSDGMGARLAYVFVRTVKDQAFQFYQRREVTLRAAEALILGHVIAHEAGHLMLPPDAHSVSGIMRAKLDLYAMDQALRGILLFTPAQSKLIRAALLTQAAR